ncbi:MAG TPA: ATP-binding protein [Candidatus Eisenbacteria bacterium]
MVVATAVSSWLGYRGVKAALGSEFERRLEHMATAQQISPDEVDDIRLLREDSNAYGAVDAQLTTFRAATGVEDVSLIDSARVTLFDAGHQAREFEPTPLDSVAGPALARALRGQAAVSAPFRRGDRILRAGFAPVRRADGSVAGAVAIEAEAAYLGVVLELRRTLTGIALATMLAIGLLAVIAIRGAWAAARLERRLSRAENLAAMGRLTATLAHEIKNPLAIIRGSAERLGRLEPEARRMADFVVEETDRLTRTVARYLQFARVAPATATGAGGDAVGALEATLDLLEGELAARAVQLERAGAFPPAAPVALDDESLKQLYLNLMLNAIEAMEQGGRLRVAAAERTGRIEVSLADSGPGIPADVLRRLGSPFYTTKASGSGLGLFLARRLAESAGGDLKVTSVPGQGTTCTVRFPRRKG